MGFQAIRGVLTVILVFASVLVACYLVMDTASSSDLVVGILSKEYADHAWPGSHWQVQTQVGRFQVEATHYPEIVKGARYRVHVRGANFPSLGIYPHLNILAEVPSPPK